MLNDGYFLLISDDKIRVTVAVVVSCIGVFLVVLLFVVLYLRRKRRGVL